MLSHLQMNTPSASAATDGLRAGLSPLSPVRLHAAHRSAVGVLRLASQARGAKSERDEADRPESVPLARGSSLVEQAAGWKPVWFRTTIRAD
jgi:hypothetical protein